MSLDGQESADSMQQEPQESASFQTVVNRKRPSSPLQLLDTRKQTRSSDSISVSNRFSALPLDVPAAPSTADQKEKRPPPIYVTNVNNYQEFLKVLIPAAEGVEFKCKSSLDSVTVYTSTSDLYRKFVSLFKSLNATFHSFQLPEDKPFRVVLRGLHFSTPTDLIKEELTKLGFQVRNVVNIISRFKRPLPLFYIDLDPRSPTDDIYKITRMLHTVVNVEDVRQHHKVVQCTRCQNFNHTKAYCNHPPKCVKCAGNHFSQDCKKSKESPATCALCQQPHTANYRGCNVFQELQRLRHQNSAKFTSKNSVNSRTSVPVRDTSTFPNLPQSSRHQADSSIQNPNGLYSSNSNNNNHNNNNNNTGHFENYVKNDVIQNTNLVSSISNLNSVDNHSFTSNNQHSYSSKLRGEQHQPPDSFNSLSLIISNFLSDIKNLIMPLMSLLTQLTQALLTKNGL